MIENFYNTLFQWCEENLISSDMFNTRVTKNNLVSSINLKTHMCSLFKKASQKLFVIGRIVYYMDLFIIWINESFYQLSVYLNLSIYKIFLLNFSLEFFTSIFLSRKFKNPGRDTETNVQRLNEEQRLSMNSLKKI